MALPEVPQVLSSEDEIMSHSLLDAQLICASRWSSESNKPGTWTQGGSGQQLGGQTVAHQGRWGCDCLPLEFLCPQRPVFFDLR